MAKQVAATYGDALFQLAVEMDRVDSFYEEAQAVLSSFRENEELTAFLAHPKIVKEEKIKTIETIFGKFVSKEMTGFLVTIVAKDRSSEINSIFNYFTDKVKEHKKIGTAYVTTPMELSGDMKKKVMQRLLDTTGYKEFEMVYSVEPELIGGMVIRIGDRVVDSSIRSKLDMLSRRLNKIDV
ncbi:MAG: ATP synthase F1 subunit delta [Butyrivibrio sp.]